MSKPDLEVANQVGYILPHLEYSSEYIDFMASAIECNPLMSIFYYPLSLSTIADIVYRKVKGTIDIDTEYNSQSLIFKQDILKAAIEIMELHNAGMVTFKILSNKENEIAKLTNRKLFPDEVKGDISLFVDMYGKFMTIQELTIVNEFLARK